MTTDTPTNRDDENPRRRYRTGEARDALLSVLDDRGVPVAAMLAEELVGALLHAGLLAQDGLLASSLPAGLPTPPEAGYPHGERLDANLVRLGWTPPPGFDPAYVAHIRSLAAAGVAEGGTR